MAQVRRHDLAQAEAELRVLEGLADDPALEALKIWDANSTAAVLRIASKVLAGELAAARGQRDEAIGLFEQAVRLEDALRYDEPATWYAPVRETLGAALLEAGRADEAEAVYREDLRRYPENGFGLFGLAASLRAQGKLAEADEAQERFKTAWQRADVELTSSRF
jgi:tetratricopeptide (TPR) repeat protein